MEIVSELLKKTISLIISAGLIYGAFYVASALSRKSVWGKLPGFVYFPLAAVLFFKGYYLVSLSIAFICVSLHVSMYFLVSFYHDRRRLNDISDDDTLSLSIFLADKDIIFQKKKAEMRVRRLLDEYVSNLFLIRHGGNKEVFNFMIMILNKYKNRGYKPVPVDIRSIFYVEDVNSAIKQIMTLDWQALVDESEKDKSGLEEEYRLAVDSKEKSDLKERIEKADSSILFRSACVLAVDRGREFSRREPIIKEFENSCSNGFIDAIEQFIPRCCFEITTDNKNNHGAGGDSVHDMIIDFHIMPRASGITSIIYDDSMELLEAAKRSLALVIPSVNSIEIRGDFISGGTAHSISDEMAFFHEGTFDSGTYSSYMSNMLGKLSKYIGLEIFKMLGIEVSNNRRAAYDQKEKGGIPSGLRKKILDDFKEELKSKSGDKVESMLASIGPAASLSIADLERIFDEDTLTKVFNKNRDEIEDYLLHVESRLQKSVAMSFSGFVIDPDVPDFSFD